MTSSTLDDVSRQRIFSKALRARFVEEALLSLFSEGKLYGTVHTCIGQEMSGSVLSEHLVDGDTIFSNHRCHGHFLARHGDIEGLIAELMGRSTGVSGGMGGSQHLCKDGFFSNGIQGGIVPVAAGLAFAHKLKRSGNVSVVFIGDGTLGEGVVYETFNIASKWNLPLLIILEDNKYSQSTAQQETLAGGIEARAAAFGIETAKADTWNWERLYEQVGECIDRIRADSSPRFLHVETFRLKAHSKGDDTRPRSEVEPYERTDPLNTLMAEVVASEAGWIEEVREEVRQAVERASLAPYATLSSNGPGTSSVAWKSAQPMPRKRLVLALADTLSQLMADNSEVLLLGEDVLSPYGGAFKATQGLSEKYPGRVLNTPISEAAIVGIGTGLGLMGFRPIVEIMFGDFIGLAFDQIVNHAAKFRQMYNYQVNTNVIVRTPMGGGRGYGPTHSQTLDRHFLGVPGLRVLAMNIFTTPEQLYRPLLTSDSGPALVIENKLLYGSYLLEAAPPGYQLMHSDEMFPTAIVRPDAANVDVTLFGYGGTSELMLEACERLFDEHDIVAQVICVMQIYPFSIDAMRDVLGEAPGLLIVEEGQGFAGFGAEVLSQLAERDLLGSIKVRRLHPAEHCIPSSGPLEKDVLPSVSAIVDAVLGMK